MYNKVSFKRKLIATAVASCALSGASGLTFAQDDQMLEEVVVTGIRASLERSMDIKRDSSGVVDAISAEDIGKFPDSNLAESLQRITGVSIDRRNGEGSNVTIRGFGGENNLVTLNGRHMPAASAYGGGSGSGGTRNFGSRSFDFANLASEAVRGIQVYKTGKANVSTGGIGGTVNIQTTRPLDNPGLSLSVGAKALHDTTVSDSQDDITPELSGLVSWTDDNEMFGVSLSASYQERDFSFAGAGLNDWNIATWDGPEGSLYSFADDYELVNAPDQGQLYARPNDIRLSYSESHRERTNAQLTLQFRPVDDITMTADYTFAENHIQEHRGEQTFWFANGQSVDYLEFDDSGVATPLIYSEVLTNKDNGYEQQYRDQTNTLESLGFNVEWNVTDNFSVRLDAHDSSMESLPTAPGGTGSLDVSVAAPIHASQRAYFGADLPTVATTINDSNTNNNGMWDLNDFGTQMGRIWYADQVTDISQVKLEGTLEFDNGRFDFGVESRSMETTSKQSNNQLVLGNWGVNDAGQIDDGLLREFDMRSKFEDYDMSNHQAYAVRATDPVALMTWATDTYNYPFEVAQPFTTNNDLKEDTQAVFLQASFDGALGDMTTKLTAGVRYETTDVDSSSLVAAPLWLTWNDNNDFLTETDGVEAQPYSVEASYDNLLPSLDFSIDLTDDVVSRFSYSKTIARAGYGSLAVSASNFATVGSTYLGTQPTAQASNPGLLPLESDNFDVSFEWYYNDASYASVAFFEKRVANFIGQEQVLTTHFGIKDQTNGPRIRAAADALEAEGMALNDTNLFVMMGVLEHPGEFGTPSDIERDGNQVTPEYQGQVVDYVAGLTPYEGIIPADGDPEMEFLTATPTNNREAKLYGSELAIQHFFGETGFGVQANYTIVRGDVGFDDLADPSESQFALTGLSDSANLILMYENYGVSARLAYNWRDEFLNETNRGNGNNPTYVEAYSQVDMNVSYDISDNFTVFLEGINITEENTRHHGRSEAQLWYLEDMGARYALGGRYTF
ncbi:TonB-dependent receptor [Gilvimarinus agarilyticus]|uniref:TonB-dependent receptor n=1 Tax=Gilvimarinus agarilyticus TaxID=679259 RepID=UPI0005A0BA48|nr:TonB-dependent receptor [Gilvimarinus agarilyticus]